MNNRDPLLTLTNEDWGVMPATWRLNLVAHYLLVNYAYVIEPEVVAQMTREMENKSLLVRIDAKQRFADLVFELRSKKSIPSDDELYLKARPISRLEAVEEARASITDLYRTALWMKELSEQGLTMEDAENKAGLLAILFLQKRYPALVPYLERLEYVSLVTQVDKASGRYITFATVSTPTGYEFFRLLVDLATETVTEIRSGNMID